MSNTDLLVEDPEEIARRVAKHLHKLSLDTAGDELVYSPFGKHSYYSDLISHERGLPNGQSAWQRLERHAEQMKRFYEERERRAWDRFASGLVEYRVTPDRTDGHGGYFSPPAWLNQLFATANRPGRVLAGLMTRFALPAGVSSVNIPLIGAGTAVQPAVDDAAVLDQDFTDAETGSSVVPFSGQADVALQLLEQSPAGAHLDWALFMDLSEAYDEDLETELLVGPGGASLLGVTNVKSIGGAVTYTDASPTGSKMWSHLGQVPAGIGKTRKKPPECWLMTTSRWAWFEASEDTAERPFGLSTKFFLGNDDNTPDPVSGMMGWPVFLDDAIPTNLGAGGKQDFVASLRPRDMMLLEGVPQTAVMREPGSGSLGVRLQMHANVAALTARRPAGIGILSGTGMTVAAGY
jgi:hypothetical protein